MPDKNFLKHLFLDSQNDEDLREAADDARLVEHLFERAEDLETAEEQARPLLQALRDAAGIEGDDIIADTSGIKLRTPDQSRFNEILAKIAAPDVMAKLGEMGWVASKEGDVNALTEPACFTIKFLKISVADTSTGGYANDKEYDDAMRAAAEKDLGSVAPDPAFTHGPETLPEPGVRESVDSVSTRIQQAKALAVSLSNDTNLPKKVRESLRRANTPNAIRFALEGAGTPPAMEMANKLRMGGLPSH